MIGLGISVKDNGLIDAYIQLCLHVESFVNTVTQRTVNDLAPEVLEDFQQEPGPVHRPIRWTSPKQRRFVMMAIRRGLIQSPYTRTHALSQGWKIEVVYTPGSLTSIALYNTVWYATFVEGLRQQSWHKTTGWFSAPERMEKWSAVLTDRIETDLIKAFDAVDGSNTYAG